MAVELRPTTAVLALLAVLGAGTFGSFVITETVGGEYDATAESVTLDDGNYHLWLYTSREPSFDQRTLAINVIVYGDPNDIQRQLLEEGRGDWNETGQEEQDIAPAERSGVVNATSVEWETADGAQRYIHLVGPLGRMWLSEDYQLHDGDYLGSRHHVRAYTSPDDDSNWTAIQAHRDHWDWFNARHVVTSVDESQAYLEQEFSDQPGSPEITRVPVGGGGRAKFDRWLTVVDFRSQASLSASVVLLVFLGTITSRFIDIASGLGRRLPEQDARALLLATGIVTIVMFVRLTGIGLERTLNIRPKIIAALLYPVLFAGLPIGAYLLSRQLNRARAFSGASLGFLAAVLMDYTYLGVTHLPLDVLVHRGGLAVALGLIAIGSSHVERRDPERVSHVQFGVLLWLVATTLPLLRLSPLPV